MKLVTNNPVPAQYSFFCDVTKKEIDEDGFEQSLPMLGCTIQFNANYRGIADGTYEFNEVHLSEKVTREFLAWLKDKYPNAPLVLRLKHHLII